MTTHQHFTREQRKKAKLDHKNFKKYHSEAYDSKRQKLLARTVDMFAKQCTFDCRLSLSR